MRKLPLVLLLVVLCQSADAQFIDRWRSSVGAGAAMLEYRDAVSPAIALFYNPQVNYINRFSDFSMAVAMPIMLGVHPPSSFIDKTFFYGHLPLITEANIGHYATRDYTNAVGMSIGGGYAMQVTDRGIGHGPVGTASIRTAIKTFSFTIRYQVYFNLRMGEDIDPLSGYNSHNIVFAVNLGRFFKKLNQMNKISRWQGFK